MKRFLSLSIIALLIVSSFTACKKGDNDPFSLRSRKARLTGVWVLKNVDLKETEVNDGNTNITAYAYDGTIMTVTENGESGSYSYSETIEIKKDGTFVANSSESKQILNQTGETTTWTTKVKNSGVWNFLYGNKELGVKNKERVQFIMEKSTITFNFGEGNVNVIENTFEGEFSQAFLFGPFENNIGTGLLDRLSNKELVFNLDNTTAMGEDYIKITGTKTYEKK